LRDRRAARVLARFTGMKIKSNVKAGIVIVLSVGSAATGAGGGK
jgi:hypothetical protein